MNGVSDKLPRLSVITVVKDDAGGLQKTLASLQAQTRCDAVEWIVVDGESSDGTVDVIKGGEGLVSEWVSEPDAGIYDAMNKGVAMSHGALILFLNAGDVFHEADALARFFDIHDRPESPHNLYLCDVLTDTGKTKRPKMLWLKPNYMLPAHHQGMIYPADMLRAEPYSLRYRISADVHQFLRIRHKVRLVPCDMVLAVFDTTGISSVNVEARDDEYRLVYEELRINPVFRLLKRLHELHARLRGH